jgi:hypothetical protein
MMKYKEYDIVNFHPDLIEGALKVLTGLWGDDMERNRSYFEWKYTHNPYSEKDLGIVAMRGKEVVGFRGYFASQWKLPHTDEPFVFLSPGDTYIQPEHRMKKLSFVMGQMAMDNYGNRYRLFLNFSSNKKAAPGYLKMGFFPLVPKRYLNRITFPGAIKYIVSSTFPQKSDKIDISNGLFGFVEVSDFPKPKEMADVVSMQEDDGPKIRLHQNEAFFRWRFNNHRKIYKFYYFRQEDKITGYMVMRLLMENRRGYIIDYAAKENVALEKMIAAAINSRCFSVISIIAYSVSDHMAAVLAKLNFKRNGIIRMIEKKINGEWPVLVRPVRINYSERDFFIEGMDIRNLKSWSFREICSDGS